MQIKLLKSVAEEIGLDAFKPYGINPDSWGWKNDTFIDLSALNKKEISKLRFLIDFKKNVRGTRVMIRDIDTWLKALDVGAEKTHARSCRQFEPLLTRLIGQFPGHRIYQRFEEMDDIYLCYYVEKIDYIEERTERDNRHPAHVNVHIIYESFGGKKEERIIFYIEDIRGKNTIEALASKGFYIETEELRSVYLDQMKRFGKTVEQIGKQYLASGMATDKDMDGNPSGRDSSWYWHRTNHYKMERDGSSGRVLIDIFKEEEGRDRDREVHVDTWFWTVESNMRLIKQKGGKEDRGK
ncbi:MAG: hypothetical protein Q8M94_11635, partial [Ignavibacteria bacterium]|nr:hypothetical protein [Ignavibacteria bacterium]